MSFLCADCQTYETRIREIEALLLSIRGYMYPGNVMPVPEQAKYIVKWIDAAIPQSDADGEVKP